MSDGFSHYDYLPATGFDQLDLADATRYHSLSFFETDGFHVYYFDSQLVSAAQVNEMAGARQALVEAASDRPLFLFGHAGKYILSPAPTLLTAEYAIAFDPTTGVYGPEIPFDIDFFGEDDDETDITPTRYLNRALSALGFYTLPPAAYQQLLAALAPVEAQYQAEVAARRADQQTPRFRLSQYYNGGQQSYPLMFSTLARARAALHQDPAIEYAIITNLETQAIAYSDQPARAY